MLGNGVLGIQRETCSHWERRAPLTPAHCAQILHDGRRGGSVHRIIVQPCTKRVHHDDQYERVGCVISEDLSQCGLILGVKQPELGTLLPERAYAFFSHTHKAQPENMPLLDEVLAKQITLYDYERIVGDKGERLVAFGEYAGRAGLIDFLRGLGQRYLSLGHSTPFLSVGSSYMYSSLSAAKAAVLTAGDEIRTTGLPFDISPLIFVFTGTGNVSRGAQEIFRLLPHKFVHPSELPQLVQTVTSDFSHRKRTFQVYGCIVAAEHMVHPNNPQHTFDKANYYAHPEQYHSVFHEKIVPYASVIVNGMYWESRYPRLLTNEQLRKVLGPSHNKLIGFADITCDIGGSIECVNRITTIEKPFYRYNSTLDSYSDNLDGQGVIIMATDNLPAELAKEATNHFGDVLLGFIPNMATVSSLSGMLLPVQHGCIAHKGKLAPLYDYIQLLRLSNDRRGTSEEKLQGMQFKTMVALDGHLFDQFLINEALDVIEKAGGKFHLATCELGQTMDATSHAEIEVMASSEEALSNIVDLLASIADRCHQSKPEDSPLVLVDGQAENSCSEPDLLQVLVIGAGRMCEPAVSYLAHHALGLDQGNMHVLVTVASLFLEDAIKVIEDLPNTTAVQLDVTDSAQLHSLISKVSVVISLLPPACHVTVANCCIKAGKHLVTASYVSEEMSTLHEKAKSANVVLLCEMGLDPGIDHMMAMKMINDAHLEDGCVGSFISYCGGLPSPACADNPLGYKFSWNPAGALKAGRNPAVYKDDNQIISVPGDELFSSAVQLRLPELPAFALERLPNRDSLQYGEVYGISAEASTIFRATLRYEGFSEIMNSLAKLGYFGFEPSVLLQETASSRPSYHFLLVDLMRHLVSQSSRDSNVILSENDPETLVRLRCCKDLSSASKTLACIRYLGLDAEEAIPTACRSPFDVLCSRMEEKLSYSPDEQDMVLLHHEIVVMYDNGRPSERRSGTLMEFGDVKRSGDTSKVHSAMARTVGLPAAIGAQLLLQQKIKSRGVLRPLEPEIYVPVLKILEASGVHFKESVYSIRT